MKLQRILIAVTALLVVVTLPHALEDFQYGDLMRFGVSIPLGICVLAAMYMSQSIGMLLVARGRSRGALLLAALGGIWCIGAIIVHGHDMIFAGPLYRHGAISKILELLIIVLGVASVVLGLRTARMMTDA
jgi:hypothetical protein